MFGGVSSVGRRRAVALVNRLPGRDVLEVGVGTGLALPRYTPDKRITGIDLSAEMLHQARKRVASLGLPNVAALRELDAESTDFPDASFDIAVAMFVASVVPHPRGLLAEMRRVVRPGGNILFVNHFAAERGPRWWIEWAMAPASRALGWHPDFAMQALFSPRRSGADARQCRCRRSASSPWCSCPIDCRTRRAAQRRGEYSLRLPSSRSSRRPSSREAGTCAARSPCRGDAVGAIVANCR